MTKMVRTCAAVLVAGLIGQTMIWGAPSEAVRRAPLEVTHTDDFELGASHTSYAAVVDGERVPVELPTDTGYLTEADVLVAGDASGVEAVGVLPMDMRPTATGTTTKKVAVILFNFSNNSNKPYTTSQVRALTYTNTPPSYSVNAYYQENSFGKIRIEGKLAPDGDVYGWYTIPHSSTTCDTSTWRTAAINAAKANGFDPAGYQSVVFEFPYTSACKWAGLASSLLAQGYSGVQAALINGTYAVKTVSHELGHNFGVSHARAYNCTQSGVKVPLGDSCTVSEYGDQFDVMGSGFRHMNNVHKRALGYLDTAVQTITTTGAYTIAPIELAGTTPQAYRVARPDGTWLWLEFRRPYGVDSFPTTWAVVNGVSVRVVSGSASYLVDMTPTSSYGFQDSALVVGKTFTDPKSGVTLQTLQAGASGVVVDVTVPGSSPAPSPTASPTASPTPSPILSPSPSPSASPSPSPTPSVAPSPTPVTGAFSDDFDRTDAAELGNGWTQALGSLLVSGGLAVNAGVRAAHCAVQTGLVGPTQTVGADFTSADNNNGPRFGVVLRYQDPLNYYWIHRRSGGSSLLVISKVVGGTETVLKQISVANPTKGVPFRLVGRAAGSTITLEFANGSKVISVDDTTFASGSVGFQIWTAAGASTFVPPAHKADNFTVSVS